MDNRVLSDHSLELIGSFTKFKMVFYEELTKRPYVIHEAVSREPREITFSKELTKVKKLETLYLAINTCPGSGKSNELCLFVAWCYAHYPDSNFLYVANGYALAERNTYNIKKIIQLPLFYRLFQVCINKDSNAKGYFTTNYGGTTGAFGSAGDIVGFDAGYPNAEHFSGALILDDLHKPVDVFSDTLRPKVITNYQQSFLGRRRSPKVPVIAIGQRLHEDDIFAYIESARDGYPWRFIKLITLDEHHNNLCPDVRTTQDLVIMREKDPYTFYSQYQQSPTPAGGGLFKYDWFKKLPIHPNVIKTFITVDTAETDKSWNDATVFSFWGIYKILHNGIDTGLIGLHWLDCLECRVEPKDLEPTFSDFYMSCMAYHVKPRIAAIERKSTGVTLCSVLEDIPGLQIMPIERNRNSGTKTARFMACQTYTASKQITFDEEAKHFDNCMLHMCKITGNNTHAHDDIADTFADAVHLALIDKIIYTEDSHEESIALSVYERAMKQQATARIRAWS